MAIQLKMRCGGCSRSLLTRLAMSPSDGMVLKQNIFEPPVIFATSSLMCCMCARSATTQGHPLIASCGQRLKVAGRAALFFRDTVQA